MTNLTPSHSAEQRQTGDDTIKSSLAAIEILVQEGSWQTFDIAGFEAVEEALRHLHAKIRVHHAVDALCGTQVDGEACRPELADDQARLAREHTTILGMLDRIIRAAGTMADRTLEDREVFFARIREMIAIVRRHEAEEDRIIHLSMWRDMGGES